MKHQLLPKRYIVSLLLTLATTLSWASFGFEVDGIYYRTHDYSINTVYVTYATKDYNSYSGSVVIPSVVSFGYKDYVVTEIGQDAFYKCADLTSVIVPESIISIGSRAFCRCSSLSSIAIPESVTSIGSFAFYACDKLLSISIPKGVTKIGNDAFSKCSNLTSVAFPVDEVDIDGEIFSDCTSLPIEDNIRYADKYLVEAVDKTLSTYKIKAGTKYLGSSAFSDCTNLKSITIPESVTNAGSGVFEGCTNLPVENNVRYADTFLVGAVDKTQSTYTIKEGTRIIAGQAFSRCTNLISITIPNSVISIGYEAFLGCRNFKTLVINSNTIASKTRSSQQSLHSLFSNGFRSYLEECIFGEEVKEIGSYCLYVISGIESKLSSVILLGNVTSIGAGAFENNSSITNISLPKSMKSIGYSAFNGCPALNSVTCLSDEVPDLGTYGFTYGNKSVLYVPEESLSAYKTTYPWSKFGTILPIDPTAVEELKAFDSGKDVNAPFFDLMGRRLQQKPASGYYIQGGKKYIVK